MNSLNRKIEEGEVVVLDKDLFKQEYRDIKHRLFVCTGGFGMSHLTSGRALFGHFLEDGEECRYQGYDVDREETEAYQAEHGKFPKENSNV